VAQTKVAAPSSRKAASPPVYRPQPTAKVLQRKIVSEQQSRVAKSPNKLVASQYRNPGNHSRGSAIQRAELPKAVGYGSLKLEYDDNELATAAAQLGLDKGGYSGHLSGKPGDAESETTIRVQQSLAEQARKNREKAKAAKKKGPVKEEAAKSENWKAFNKGYLLMQAALKVPASAQNYENEALNNAVEEYDQYLTERVNAGKITAEVREKCDAYWEKMLSASKLIPPDEFEGYVK
jgi:hypothetical protein